MIRLVHENEDGGKYILFHLNNYESFWKRIWIAIRYVFNFQEIDYDCYYMNPEDKEKFLEWINK